MQIIVQLNVIFFLQLRKFTCKQANQSIFSKPYLRMTHFTSRYQTISHTFLVLTTGYFSSQSASDVELDMNV